jgi:hypothetical protein
MWMSFFIIIIIYHVTDYLLFVWIKFSRICWTIYILNLLNVHNDFLFRLVHKLNTSIHILNFIIYIMNLLYIYICIFNHSSKCIIFVVFTIRKHKQINYKDIFHGFLNNKKRSKTYDDMTHLFFLFWLIDNINLISCFLGIFSCQTYESLLMAKLQKVHSMNLLITITDT